MSIPTLLAVTYSPWSMKAYWALRHHGLRFVARPHLAMVGEGLLRWRSGKWTGRVTVPCLLAPEGTLMDSYEILQYAEKHGEGEPLIPAGQEARCRALNEEADTLLAAGRALTTARTLGSPRALIEMLPGPTLFKPPMLPISLLATRFLARKYSFDVDSLQSHRETQERLLSALRKHLEEAGGDFLLGEFSAADIAFAIGLSFVAAAGPGRDGLGPHARACWFDQEAAASFPDLLSWRDRIYSHSFPGTIKLG